MPVLRKTGSIQGPRKSPQTASRQAEAFGSVDVPSDPNQLDPAQVARLAHSYWEARRGQGGSPEDDWYRAEQELRGRSMASTAAAAD